MKISCAINSFNVQHGGAEEMRKSCLEMAGSLIKLGAILVACIVLFHWPRVSKGKVQRLFAGKAFVVGRVRNSVKMEASVESGSKNFPSGH